MNGRVERRFREADGLMVQDVQRSRGLLEVRRCSRFSASFWRTLLSYLYVSLRPDGLQAPVTLAPESSAMHVNPRRRRPDFIRCAKLSAQPSGISHGALDVSIHSSLLEKEDDLATRTLPRIAAL
jgi:hypothetical protein